MRPNDPTADRHVWVRATATRDAGYAGWLRQHQIAALRHPHHVVERSQSLTALALRRARREAHEGGLNIDAP